MTVVHALSLLLLACSALGVALLGVQIAACVRHLRTAPPEPARLPAISILKPLCGVDDRLQENLESFAALGYPRYEVLLGVEREEDPAYAIACAIATRFPSCMRVIVQQGAPGLNPKVNQLITLARHARHALIVISDSNVVAPEGYLHEIAAHFEDDEVGLVTHPIAGTGERSWGSLLDNVHLSAGIAPGMIAANCVAGEALVVGKSMALRRAELFAIGGFEAVKDVLAEDFVMGRRIADICGKRIAVAHRPILNVSCRRTLHGFYDRYTRWAVLQRTSVGPVLYLGMLLVNPVPLALAGFAIEPARSTFTALVGLALIKALLEAHALSAARGAGSGVRAFVALPLKDAVLMLTWIAGFVRSEVRWRGRRLAVLEGTRLVPVAPTTRSRFFPRKTQVATSRAG
jgi:ceramide glucosyltransferase